MRWAASFATLCLLAACALPPDRIAFSHTSPGANLQKIYVSTNRLPGEVPNDPKQDREADVSLAEYVVSIPPSHALGQIEWPDGPVDPSTDFAVVETRALPSEQSLLSEINAAPGNEVSVFVHGYNTTSSEALYRYAQISEDLDIPPPRVLFAWPSAGAARGYVYDRDSVLFSRDPLADLLTALARNTQKEIILTAHSMGAHLTMEVLRQLAITGRRDVLDRFRVVVLLAPDIDPDIFRSQVRAIGTLPQPFVLMTSRGDRALNLSALINIGRQKVGDLSRAEDVVGLDVTLFDFTALADGSNGDHLVPMTSPEAIGVLRDLIQSERRGKVDLSGFEVGDDGVIRAKPRTGS